jgi:hypothetical protein
MSDEEFDAAWDLWFDLAQETNASDPPYSHGVLVGWAPPAPESHHDDDRQNRDELLRTVTTRRGSPCRSRMFTTAQAAGSPARSMA